MKTQVTGFILMGVAAVLTTISVGIPAVLPAASAFLAGMYFGILISTKNTAGSLFPDTDVELERVLRKLNPDWLSLFFAIVPDDDYYQRAKRILEKIQNEKV